MRRFAIVVTAACLAAGMAMAETWSGTLVDVMCKNKDLAGHTTKCALSCARSGFGVVTADGKFIKFDETGNSRTLALLKATSKEKDLKVKVNGSLDQDTIHVETVALQ